MIKKELVAAVAAKLSQPEKPVSDKQVSEFIDALLETIYEGCKKDDMVYINDLGTFKKKIRAARKGKKPGTNIEVDYPAKTGIRFKASKKFVASV